MAYDVYVCCAYHDKELAEELWDGLELRGLRSFNEHPYDDAQPDDSWEQVLHRGIENSRVVVLVFSLAANRSPHVRDELEYAAERNIPIIPFMIEAAAPFYMDVFSPSIEWIDAIAPPIGQHIDRLTDEIQALLEEPPPKSI
jgi:hypothetical protein